MRARLAVVVSSMSCLLLACPADGPLETSNDVGSTTDMGTLSDVPADGSITLNSVTPTEGPAEGGTSVTLTGEGFEDGLVVRFGSSPPVPATVNSAQEATAVTPPSTTAGSVTVTAIQGDDSSSLQNGFTYTGEPGRQAFVEYCRLQAQSPASASAGSPSPVLYAIVFADGVTQGDGQGSGVEGELGYGTGGDVGSFQYVPMAYNVDIDGLTPGDKANDEYGAALTVADAGTYRYVARFRYGTEDWVTCDLDGSDNGTAEDQLGVLEVADTSGLVDSCKLQFPNVVVGAEVGQGIDFFGRVVANGITGSQQPNAALTGELFVGPMGSNPETDIADFDTYVAGLSESPLGLSPSEDEYTASAAAAAAGEFVFGYRFSLDAGASWTYCGLSDSAAPSGTFAPDKLGYLNATDEDTIDYCHVWQDTLADDANADTQPLVTVEVFEDPLTVDNGGANSAMIEVEAAAVPLEVNPALATVDWESLPYKDLRPGVANNYEYEGTPYTDSNHPAAGTYNVVARVRRAGNTAWTYCDIDETADAFRLEAASRLTIQ